MGTTKNVIVLLGVEAFGIFLLHYTLLYLFGINIFDFQSPRGHMIGLVIAAVCLYAFYVMLFDGGVQTLGADAVYNPNDKRRGVALSKVNPLLL